MNTTTAIASHVTNTTPFTSPDDPGGNHTVEAYTVVLSVTAHLTSMLFGGGSSAAVITAVMTKGNINKYSYLLVLTLFFACCSINFVWSPMEISDLLVHHFHLRHPTAHFVAAKTAVYVFLVALININIVLLSLEGVIRIANCFGRILQRIWPLTASLFALAWSAILTAIFVSRMVENSDSASNFYVLTEYDTRVTYLTLIIFIFSLSCLVLFVLIIQFLKIHIYWESGRPHFRKKKMNLALPEFLISQSNNVCDDDTGGYDNVNEPSTSRSPSPSTPKLLMVSSPDTASIKGDDATPVSNATPKTSGNRLGINMGQILGRRRHTICQISDSTNSSTAPADPLVKAKQYNYVRKFSVDVSALQAQLQNPKIFKEAPFQSDIDLTKKGDDPKSRTQKPLQPLQPLNLKLNEPKGLPKPANDIKVETPPSAGLSIPPPVIMVSNDDVIPETNDVVAGENENVDDKPTDNTPTTTTTPVIDEDIKDNCNHQINRPEKPTSLPLKENRIDDVASVPTLESAVTDPSDTELESSKLARLAVYMGITFLLTMIPVLVTEALWHSMSTHAFVNISTCTLAISTIQTIIYPHLIACSDDVVHRAVQRLNDRVKRIFCRGEFGHQPHNVDETSSTSQV